MKKTWKVFAMLILAVIICLTLASCGGDSETTTCETHTDADNNMVCDVCGSEIESSGPSQLELELADKEAIAENMNTFLSSGISLINGERVLPSMSGPVNVETNLPAQHWISRLQGFYITDGKIKMTLVNDNRAATAETKDVYIGIAPTGIYAIEDDTITLDYTTHLYTPEQMRVVTEEWSKDQIKSNGDGTYSLSHEALVALFSRILLTNTSQAVAGDLYDRQLINRLVDIMKSSSSIKLDDQKRISECKIYMYTEDNGLKTDICTVTYTYAPAKQYIKISLNLNYIMDVEYTNVATSTYRVFNQTFKYHTEKPGDRSFRGTDIVLTSRYSKDETAFITFPEDIQKKMTAVENTLFYAKDIQKKYSSVYNIVNESWACGSVYVYDERYETYVLLESNEETSGRQVSFSAIEFDCDTSVHCIGVIDHMTKRISIIQHSEEELINQALSIKYGAMFTASSTFCTNVAVYDEEYKYYVLFKRVSDGSGGFCYKFNGSSTTIDKTEICVAEVTLPSTVLRMVEHNTDHTSH